MGVLLFSSIVPIQKRETSEEHNHHRSSPSQHITIDTLPFSVIPRRSTYKYLYLTHFCANCLRDFVIFWAVGVSFTTTHHQNHQNLTQTTELQVNLQNKPSSSIITSFWCHYYHPFIPPPLTKCLCTTPPRRQKDDAAITRSSIF